MIQALMCDSSWQTSQCFKKRLLPSSIVVVVAVLVMNNHTFFAKKVSLPPNNYCNRIFVFPKQVVNGLRNDLVNCLVIEV